ncbi:MAG: hypothetical protein A3E38_01770 [Candidatus Moranbacteria bacterium RIFCSPHIGHO2_12_FULL_54_9]|nr:MAG: hypothetical protein A3E38_01770 [Candidatus Moranbacteria bacterium RIFCSPHIGHO2_12_FULL_54_9]
MGNMYEYPLQSPPLPEDEAGPEEKVTLAKNFVQVYFADLDYRNRHTDEKDVPEAERRKTVATYGQEFERWYTSAEGSAALSRYAEQHDKEAIIQQKDMAELVRSFLAFKNRSSR